MPILKKLVWKFSYFFIELLRFVFPVFIFSYPIFTVVTTIFLDAIDAEFASQGVLSHSKYQIVDKLMDNWWNLWALAYSYFAFNSFFILLLVLLVFRFIGLAIFLNIKRRGIFMIFPNFFENAFFLFFFATFLGYGFLISGANLYYSLAVVFALKLVQEYWVHILKKSLVEDVFKFKWRKW
jgi:hypothetical protein